MAGAFQTSRDIFENPIWQNIVEFRLFFLIYGKATFKEGVKKGNTVLNRGQWIRSFRNLQTDLMYLENRSEKTYSLSTIKRAVDNLVKQERIKILECELGTLFEVVNYAKYQDLNTYKNVIENAERTESEQQENSNETQREQQRNNNKNGINVNKVKEGKDNSGTSPQRFIPPTIEEIKQYCKERNNDVDTVKFFNFYTSKGWMVGKNKMKDWKAAIITWEKPKEKGELNFGENRSENKSDNKQLSEQAKRFYAKEL